MSPQSRSILPGWATQVSEFINSKCNLGIATSTIFKEQEEEKKWKYQQRVLDIEMGSFTPLVFGTNGWKGADCNCFLKRLAEKLSEKNEEPYHINYHHLDWNIAFFWDFKIGTHMRKRLQDTFPQNSARRFYWWLPFKCERSGCPLIF